MGSVAHTRGGDPQGNRAAMAASGTFEFALFAPARGRVYSSLRLNLLCVDARERERERERESKERAEHIK